MRLVRDQSALVVVDVQERLFPLIHDGERLARETVRLIGGCHALAIPIVVTEQYSKGLGSTIAPVREALGQAHRPLEKMSFSCWGDNVFVNALAATGRRQVLLCGIETHVCVYQTALDLLESGYGVHLVTDAVGSRTTANRELAIRRIEQAGGVLTSVEMALFELLRVSGSDEFRKISRLVK